MFACIAAIVQRRLPPAVTLAGDIVHNAAGEIICAVQIFAGKTDASLPLPGVRALYPQIQFYLSHNHWANIDTKKHLIKHVWKWVCDEWAKDGRDGDPRCIYFLDCWPVNLTEELRNWVKEKCPGMRLRFIPAGGTGKYQVNDTHIHKPSKDSSKKAAQKWRLDKIMAFRAECNQSIASGTAPSVAQAELHQKVTGLMSMKMLRTVAPGFLWAGCNAVLARDEAGLNIIQRGWNQLYLDQAMAPGFVVQARQNLQARLTAAAFAAGQAAAQRAAQADAAAPADVGAGSVASVAHPILAVVPPMDDEALTAEVVAGVAAHERAWHEHTDATAPITGKKRRAGRTAQRAEGRNKRVAIDTEDLDAAAEPASATPAAATAAAVADDCDTCALVTAEELADKTNDEMRDMCRDRGIATNGTKAQLSERLVKWRPGVRRDNRGRKPKPRAGPAAEPGPAAAATAAEEAMDAEENEEEEEEPPADACLPEEEPNDPDADAWALAEGLALAQGLDAGDLM